MKKEYILAGAVILAGLTAKFGIDTINLYNSKQILINKPAVQTTLTNTNTLEQKVDSNKILLARTLFGESRDCIYPEKIIIGYTAINRNRYWYNNKKDLSEVLLEKWQYSCFWENTKENKKNKTTLMSPEKYDPEEWVLSLKAAEDVLENKYPSLNKKQTFYHIKKFNGKLMEKPKSWKKAEKLNFGKLKLKHVFYTG